MTDCDYQECSECGDILEGRHASGKCHKCLVSDIHPDRKDFKKGKRYRTEFASEPTEDIINQVLFTTKEASEISGLSPSSINLRVQSGDIKAYKVQKKCHKGITGSSCYGFTQDTVDYLKRTGRKIQSPPLEYTCFGKNDECLSVG